MARIKVVLAERARAHPDPEERTRLLKEVSFPPWLQFCLASSLLCPQDILDDVGL